ncbi:MAG: hypothetical protein R6V41_07935 [Desulfobacteraceae bacterium]
MKENAKPDYKRWNEMYYWSKKEAVYLLLGEEPVIPGPANDSSAGFGREHQELYDRLEQSITNSELAAVNDWYVSRAEVVQWAEKQGINLPGEILGNSPLERPTSGELDRMLDPAEKFHSCELTAAVCVWNEMFLKGRYNTSKGAKKQIIEFLEHHYPAMSKSQHDRISTVVMPHVLKKGAAA